MTKLSVKQCEFIKNANKRWNGKIGATQSGKTYIDTLYVIPKRILERKKKPGLVMITGVSSSTIERNILEPMREIFGNNLISEINSKNIATLFGEEIYCLGAEKVSQVSKFRGARIKYLYCDELVEYNEEVFQLLKSRLSFPYSICDFTGNPKDERHFVKKFIDTTDNLYIQYWNLYDNPFLPSSFIHALEKEYEGTVYFDRYVLGKWKNAEGIIYRSFADKNDEYIVDDYPKDKIWFINCGIDFGGNKSSHTFVATAFARNYSEVCVIKEKKISEALTPTQLDMEFFLFCEELHNEYDKPFVLRCDNEETTLINGFKSVLQDKSLFYCEVKNAWKKKINERILLTNRLMGSKRLKILKSCKNMIDAFNTAVWDDKKPDTRLDTTGADNPVDMLDAFEYSIEEFSKELI